MSFNQSKNLSTKISTNAIVQGPFQENIKMLTVPTNNISAEKYFVHQIRTSLTKSGRNFGPIQNVQYFGLKTDHEL